MDRHQVIEKLFATGRALIGMIHLGALPGSPRHRENVNAIVSRAVEEARIYRDAGFHALLIENMHDRPYPKGAADPATVAAMAVVGSEIRRAVPLPLGVQVLAAANREALAVAVACGACFIRAEGYVFAHVADEGVIESDAAALLRYRDLLDAEDVRVFVDVKKKHSAHAITADVTLPETARAAEFALADGVIVSGISTGRETDPDEVKSVAAAVSLPVFVGSGVSPENIGRYKHADGFIVGSSVKRDGLWSNPLDAGRVEALAKASEALGAAR